MLSIYNDPLKDIFLLKKYIQGWVGWNCGIGYGRPSQRLFGKGKGGVTRTLKSRAAKNVFFEQI